MSYYGDIAEDATITFKFNTNAADGTPTTLSGTPALSVYKKGSTNETTTGVTLTVDYDSRTGLNYVAVVTTDAFYTTGDDYEVVITTGTVDSISVVGVVVGIENRSAAKPGDQVDLVDAPNATAVTAIQDGLSTYDGSDTSGTTTLLSRVPDTISLAAINAEMDTAIAGYDGPTHTEMVAAFTEIKGAGWDSGTDTLEDIAAGSGGASVEAIAAEVWSNTTRTLTAVDATIISGNISGTVGGISGVTFPVNFDLLAIDANGVVNATLDSTEHDDIAVALFDLTDGVESGAGALPFSAALLASG